MFDLSETGPLVRSLCGSTRGLFEELAQSPHYHHKEGAQQIMVYLRNGPKIGGLDTRGVDFHPELSLLGA